jgi:hypothetical protein
VAEVNVFYRAKRAAHLGNAIAEAMFTRADTVALGQPVITYLPDSGKVDGQGVIIVARGNIIAGAAGNVTVNLRVGNTVAGTLLASTGAIALAAPGNYNFELIFRGMWDSNSQTLRGRVEGYVGATAVAMVAGPNPITGYNPAGTTNNNMPIIASALFGTSNAGNDIWLTELVSGTD